MKTVMKAREIEVPANLPELIDKRAGKPAGGLRNILADNGKLHHIDEEVLKIMIGHEIKSMMESDDLPKKPMSLERMAEMMFVLMLAYITGTMKFDENGELEVGGIDDIRFVKQLFEADRFEFRNGKQIPAKAMVPILRELTSKDSLKEIHNDVTKKGAFFRRTELPTKFALQLGETVIKASDGLMKSKLLEIKK